MGVVWEPYGRPPTCKLPSCIGLWHTCLTVFVEDGPAWHSAGYMATVAMLAASYYFSSGSGGNSNSDKNSKQPYRTVWHIVCCMAQHNCSPNSLETNVNQTSFCLVSVVHNLRVRFCTLRGCPVLGGQFTESPTIWGWVAVQESPN